MGNIKVRFKLNDGGNVKIPFNDATCRQRGIRIYDGLRDRGWDADAWDGKEKCDVIIAQWNPEFIPLCRGACDYLVFDCNDAVFSFGSGTSKFSGYIAQCDWVITGSTRILSYISRYINPLCCSYMPECIDPMYDKVIRKPAGTGRILWMGGSDNINYTDVIDDGMEQLAKLFSFSVIYVCPEKQASGVRNADICAKKKFNAEWVKWTPETMIRELGVCDIAIAPLHQTSWCWCKSVNKVATFASVGLPVVASDVPSYREFIDNGKNGFLAFGPNDWEEPLGVLLGNESLRKKIGSVGKKAAQKFSIDRIIDDYEKLINRI